MYIPQEINTPEISKESYDLFIHMNIASISNQTDKWNSFVNDLKCQPHFIGGITNHISKWDLIKHKPHLTNIDLPNFCFEFLTAESRKGGQVQWSTFTKT